MRIAMRWGWVGPGAVALAVLLVLVAALTQWRIDVDRLGARLSAASLLPPGLRVQHVDRAWLSLLPEPTLELVGLTLVDAGGQTVLRAPVVELSLSLLPLTVGEMSPNSARILDATANIDLDAVAAHSAEFVSGARSSIERLVIGDGSAELISRTHGIATRVDYLNGSFSWPTASTPLRASLTGDWRGQDIALEAEFEQPGSLAEGGSSPARLKLSAPLLDLALSGALTAGATPSFEGDLTAATPSAAGLERWFGIAQPAGFAPEGVAFEGKFAGGPSRFTLAEARIEIAKQKFEGSASLSRDNGRWSASATLAAENLDLSALFGPPPELTDSSGAWSAAPVLPTPSPQIDLDLRVSAAHALWGALAIDDAAASLMQMRGRATFKLLEATAYRGPLAGELDTSEGPHGREWQAAVSLSNADVGALFAAFGVKSVSGRGAFKAKLKATGSSPAELVASASGEASLDLQDGDVEGVNIEEALRRSQRHPLDLQHDLTIGGTKFKSARARLDIAGGQATIAQAKAEAAGAIVEVKGAINLLDREWLARVGAIQAGLQGAPSPDAARLSLALYGPWSKPTLAVLTGAD